MPIDFLIVAALEDEAKEMKRLLEGVRPEAELVVGTVTRWRGLGTYTVGLINLFGMGTNNSQSVTQDAISLHRPRGVLMTGIAAGFADAPSAVALGDLLVPYGIVPYELAKIQGAPPLERLRDKARNFLNSTIGWPPLRPAAVEHRGMAWAVAESLWRTAATAATDTDQPWLRLMTVGRPDRREVCPKIFAAVDSVIGSGEKVVAAKEAEVRRWLIASYPRQALGLEMESYGALRGCRNFDTPFLMAKASVDRATAEKGDDWRVYASQLSAAFLFTVLQRYERPEAALGVRHAAQCVEVASALSAQLPKTAFRYKYRIAPSFEQLRRRQYQEGEQEAEALLPNDVHRDVVLYGGGGAGKTTTVRQLFRAALAADLVPVLIDLKRLSRELGTAAGLQAQPEDVESMISVCSSPRRTVDEIRQLAAARRMLLIIDAVNEISKDALGALLSFCQTIRHEHGCVCLWTNRLAAIEGLPPTPLHATLEKVPPEVARHCYDAKFGVGQFLALEKRLQSIFLRPFFLDLTLRTERPFTGNKLWSGIFQEFFREHRSLTDEELNQLALATQTAMTPDGRLRAQLLRDSVKAEVWRKLTETEVRVIEQSGEFEHHLWRDYLLSRAFTLDSSRWTEEVFDAATTFGTSAECVSMAVEQMGSADTKTLFVKAVYDWSYAMALECVAYSDQDEEVERQLPAALREAVLAVVAEKRFDPVPRTASRTTSLLQQYAFARPYLALGSRKEMADRVQKLVTDELWLDTWKRLYCQEADTLVAEGDVVQVAAEDSLVGWTAANLARRGILTDTGKQQIRELYKDHRSSERGRSIRWRAVHVLGRWPSEENVLLLVEAITSDPYYWVQYGAARSLVEGAARSLGTLHCMALGALRTFLSEGGGGAARHMILAEIVEASFIVGATADWPRSVLPLLEEVVAAEHDGDRKASLTRRVDEFRSHAGGGIPAAGRVFSAKVGTVPGGVNGGRASV